MQQDPNEETWIVPAISFERVTVSRGGSSIGGPRFIAASRFGKLNAGIPLVTRFIRESDLARRSAAGRVHRRGAKRKLRAPTHDYT